MGETHVNEEKKSLTELMGDAPLAKEAAPTQDRLHGMRKKTDLSDIILEKENSTAARNKKIILGAASLVLIFLIFLIISKLLNSSTDMAANDETNKSEVSTQVTATSETAKVISEKKDIVDTKKSDSNDAVSETDIKFEEMVKKLREEDAKDSDTELVKVVTPTKVETPKTEKPVKKAEVKKLQEEVQSMITPTIQKPKKESKPKIIITDAKKEIKHKTPVTKKIQRPNPNLIFGQNSGYYIQVGATTSPTPNRFLVNKLRANGYSYITHPIIVKGRKFYKVLIGPFPSKDVAKAKLPRVKATINPQAFLYHLR